MDGSSITTSSTVLSFTQPLSELSSPSSPASPSASPSPSPCSSGSTSAKVPTYHRGVPCDLPQAKVNRILSNRASAQKSRDKKKKELAELKSRIETLEKEKSDLQKVVSGLQNELKFYKVQDQQPIKKLKLSTPTSLPSPVASPSSSPSSSSTASSSPSPSSPLSPCSPVSFSGAFSPSQHPASPVSSDPEVSYDKRARKRKFKIPALPSLLPVDDIDNIILATPPITSSHPIITTTTTFPTVIPTLSLSTTSTPTSLYSDQSFYCEQTFEMVTHQYKTENPESIASESAALTKPLQLEVLREILIYLVISSLMLCTTCPPGSISMKREASIQIPLLNPLMTKKILTYLFLGQMSRLTTFSHLREPPLLTFRYFDQSIMPEIS